MRWLRRGEIALCVIGFSLLGGAAAATVRSRVYQARQGRAFSDLDGRIATAAGPVPASALVSPAETRTVPALDPLVLGRIEIPRIGVSAIVREGDDDATLSVAVGRVPGTARPGEKGNMALAGHRDSFFQPLRHIRVDDVIRIRTPGHEYEYRVDSTEIVGPGELRVLAPSAAAVLTLVTCYPFGYVGSAPDRFIVRASRLTD